MVFDPNYPSNDITLKEIPTVIREKGLSLYNYINEVEKYRNSNTFNSSLNLFPEYKYLFIHSNSSIPAGLYFKGPDSWIGYSNYSFIPQSTDVPEGTRITSKNQTYELKKEGENKIWVNHNSFLPVLFFDFFETNGTNVELTNRGKTVSDIEMVLQSYERKEEEIIPFIECGEFSSIKTNKTYLSKNILTYSAMFKNISRLYSNDKLIDSQAKAVLLSINDNMQNIRIGLCYDSANNLYFYNKENLTNLGISLSTHLTYQIGLKFFNNKMIILINNEELEHEFNIEITDKNLLFGLASDMGYGRYSNGSFLVSEPQIFDFALSKEEHLWLKNFPRTWTFFNDKTYLDLTIDEQLKLKKNINKLDSVNSQIDNFNKIIENKINENIISLNEILNNDKIEINNDITKKLKILESIQELIQEQNETISTLNQQMNDLNLRILELEKKS